MNKKTVPEFFNEKNADFMKFAELFTEKLSDENLISALAEKDLEKLAKVFNLVFDRLEKSNQSDENKRLSEIINAVSSVGKEGSGE